MLKICTTIFALVLVGTTPLVNAALIHRGTELLYDSNLDVTWLRSANLAKREQFGVPTKSSSDSSFQYGIAEDGSMNYETAKSWVASLNRSLYLGRSDWRLPLTMQPDPSCTFQGTRSSGYNCIGSEMGNLYYEGLKHSFAVVDPFSNNVISPIQNLEKGPFVDLEPRLYWSSTRYEPDSSNYFFSFFQGYQGDYQGAYTNMLVMVLADGDVAQVSEPPTFALMLSCLSIIGVTAFAKRNGHLNWRGRGKEDQYLGRG